MQPARESWNDIQAYRMNHLLGMCLHGKCALRLFTLLTYVEIFWWVDKLMKSLGEESPNLKQQIQLHLRSIMWQVLTSALHRLYIQNVKKEKKKPKLFNAGADKWKRKGKHEQVSGKTQWMQMLTLRAQRVSEWFNRYEMGWNPPLVFVSTNLNTYIGDFEPMWQAALFTTTVVIVKMSKTAYHPSIWETFRIYAREHWSRWGAMFYVYKKRK